MNRTDVAYLINTTPKYFYLLRLHLTLLQRHAPKLQWPLFLATEEPEHKTIKELQTEFPRLQIISLTLEQEGFLESRAVATSLLPPDIQYVFPIQEDFLLEGRPFEDEIEEALHTMDLDSEVHSLRLMPCPGPKGDLIYLPNNNSTRTIKYKSTKWFQLKYGVDEYIFTYQATLWRKNAYYTFMNFFAELINSKPISREQKNKIAIQDNICENYIGQRCITDQGGIHLAYPRAGPWPNAVYLCPWPYRPTAVVKGKLELWAEELADRERIPLATGPSLR
jgi:hypothetical protein